MSIETMTKLATTVLSANTASVTFSNIPQNYTDLRISVSGRTTGGVGDSSELGTISFSFGSTSYTYSDRFIGGNGTAAYSSANSTAATSTPIYWVNGSGSTASTFASVNIDIPNYTLNNVKNISYEAAPEYNNSTLRMMLGTISTTKTDPVTQIVLTAGQTAFAINSTFTLYGVKAARTAVGNSIKATGGNISFDGTYVSHTFNTSGTFTPSDSLLVDYLVVAGGGGAGGTDNTGYGNGNWVGGGGGAGGLRSTVTATGGGGSLESALSLTSGTSYTVTVGAGGTGGTASSPGNNGTAGSNSVFSTITSTGGGYGGGGRAQGAAATGGTGGSGGGGGTFFTAGGGSGGAAGARTASPVQGFDGGAGGGSGTSGGGGGAGSSPTATGRFRGSGAAVSITGSSVTYATGGYGGSGFNAANATGVSNTGNGGDTTTTNNGPGNNGGSGVVIIRYRAVV